MTIQIGDGSSGSPDRMEIDHVALNIGLDPLRPGAPSVLAVASADPNSPPI